MIFFSVKRLTAAAVPLWLTAKIGRTVVNGLIISSPQQIILIIGQTPITQTALFSITMETGFWEAMGCRSIIFHTIVLLPEALAHR